METGITCNPEVRRRVRFGPLMLFLLCLVYIVSPIDLLPEAFLGPFGLVDDVGALFVAIRAFKQAFSNH